MKRSEINDSIDRAIEFFMEMRCSLPYYAYWSPDEWRTKSTEYDEIRELCLGWDVTDFGSGSLREYGRTIFTLRNGRGAGEKYFKPYAQKVMHMREGQKSVIHHHKSKMEDIINHGGGIILISLWKISGDGLSEEPLEISVSGRKTFQPAGVPVELNPGDSVCVVPGTYHQFWAKEKHGDVFSGEVSSVCNDFTDNIFLEKDKASRFPSIDEDEPTRYVLCNEYLKL